MVIKKYHKNYLELFGTFSVVKTLLIVVKRCSSKFLIRILQLLQLFATFLLKIIDFIYLDDK